VLTDEREKKEQTCDPTTKRSKTVSNRVRKLNNKLRVIESLEAIDPAMLTVCLPFSPMSYLDGLPQLISFANRMHNERNWQQKRR
jgi:hypothetical protein